MVRVAGERRRNPDDGLEVAAFTIAEKVRLRNRYHQRIQHYCADTLGCSADFRSSGDQFTRLLRPCVVMVYADW